MNIRGLTVPPLLVAMIDEGSFVRERGSWQLSKDIDAYGNFWESELGHVHASAAEIETASALLPQGFPSEEAEEIDDWVSMPGHIPYIVSFESILEFATSGDGAPFCLDYRDDILEPTVIWWDDVYWRRVAPTFSEFIGLFDLSSK
jgi:hypothetical protein